MNDPLLLPVFPTVTFDTGNEGTRKLVPVAMRNCYASVAAGAIAQNVYLCAASEGLNTVIRAWIDRAAIAEALGLTHDQEVLLSQTVGYPAARH